MEAKKPLREMLCSTFLCWQPTAHVSLVKALLSSAIKYCLERQIRRVVKSMGFSVKANVDLNLSPVAYCCVTLAITPTEF